jgi:hypothetical protein
VHGLTFLDAQAELNGMAPVDRRGEVTAAFIVCIDVLVGGSVVGAGLLGLGLTLQWAVGSVALILVLAALATAVWQWRPQRRSTNSRQSPTSSE